MSFSRVDYDEIKKPPLVYIKGDDKITGESKNGLERLKNYYVAVLTGSETGESYFTTRCIANALAVGFVYGSCLGGRQTIKSFIRKHNDYKFEGKSDAAQKLSLATMNHFVRNGCKYGLKVGLYTSYFTVFTFSSIVFRNDISHLDFCFGGSVAGAIYKFPLGPKGMISGAFVSGILGLVAASLVKTILWYSGHNIVEFRAVMNEALIEEKIRKKNMIMKESKFLTKLFAQINPLLENIVSHEKRLEKAPSEKSE